MKDRLSWGLEAPGGSGLSPCSQRAWSGFVGFRPICSSSLVGLTEESLEHLVHLVHVGSCQVMVRSTQKPRWDAGSEQSSVDKTTPHHWLGPTGWDSYVENRIRPALTGLELGVLRVWVVGTKPGTIGHQRLKGLVELLTSAGPHDITKFPLRTHSGLVFAK